MQSQNNIILKIKILKIKILVVYTYVLISYYVWNKMIHNNKLNSWDDFTTNNEITIVTYNSLATDCLNRKYVMILVMH